MNRTDKHAAIIRHFTDKGYDIVRWKGGYWIRKDGLKTFITSANAARMAGIAPKPRQNKVLLPWGDYAIIAMLHR